MYEDFFITLLNYLLFYRLTKAHIYFLPVKHTSIIQCQHSVLKFWGTPSLIKIEILALTVALLFI